MGAGRAGTCDGVCALVFDAGVHNAGACKGQGNGKSISKAPLCCRDAFELKAGTVAWPYACRQCALRQESAFEFMPASGCQAQLPTTHANGERYASSNIPIASDVPMALQSKTANSTRLAICVAASLLWNTYVGKKHSAMRRKHNHSRQHSVAADVQASSVEAWCSDCICLPFNARSARRKWPRTFQCACQ